MSTLAEIEAAAELLPHGEQEALYRRLGQRLREVAKNCGGLPVIECGSPGTLPITDEFLAQAQTDEDVERYTASLR